MKFNVCCPNLVNLTQWMFPGLLDGENPDIENIQRVTEQRNNSRMHITHELIIRVCQSQVEYFSDFTGPLCCKLHKIVMQSI